MFFKKYLLSYEDENFKLVFGIFAGLTGLLIALLAK